VPDQVGLARPRQVEAGLALTHYFVVSPTIVDHDLDAAVRVVLSTRTGRTVLVSEDAWRLLEAGTPERLPPDLTRALVECGLLVPSQTTPEHELAEVLAENQDAIATTRQLYQVIQPTAACQLGCGYCGQHHMNRQMSIENQDRFLRRVERRLLSGEYGELSIGWFGAEPLMGLPVMRRMSPLLQDLAAAHDCTYMAKIVTNGIQLTRRIAEELVSTHRITRAEVTIDGPREIHDNRRYFKQGGGSFDKIFNNLLALRDNPQPELDLVIRCNVDQSNADSVEMLIRFLAEHDLQRTLTFYLAPVYSWGNDADKGALAPTDFAAREIEWFALLSSLGFQVGLMPPRRPIVCLAVQRDGELVDATGTQFNCTEVSYVPTYGTPNRYAIDPAREDLAPFRNFNREIADGWHPTCRTCPMLPVCGGSCPKLWHEEHVPCPPAKYNMSERLVLMYAQSKNPPAG
jgi:uncharacterized protein